MLRSSTSGAPVEREFAQSAWSVDKLDGTGPSGITIDFTKTQILLIDAQWLAVGRVRIGFDVDGVFWVAHEYLNANNLILPYTQSFNLPVRCEALTTADGTDLCAGYFDSANGVFLKLTSTVQGAQMQFICCSVQSEGGEESRGFPWGISNGITGRSITTRTPVLSIRPKATYNSITNRAHVEVIDYLTMLFGGEARVEVVLGGTLTGASFASVNDSSVMEFDVAATVITGGSTIRDGYGQTGSGSRGELSQGVTDIRNPFVLSQIDALAARQLPLSVVITPFTGSVTARAALNWNEQVI